MRLLPQTIRGEFVLFALSLALPLGALIGVIRDKSQKMAQLINDLLANAIKFSGKREQPVIEVSGDESGMAGGSGPRARWARARRFIFRCRKEYPMDQSGTVDIH